MTQGFKAVVSAIVLIVVNAGLYVFGVSIDAGMLTEVVTGAGIVLVTAWGAWKNHNMTGAAQLGQRVTDAVKAKLLDEETIEMVLEMAAQKAEDGKND